MEKESIDNEVILELVPQAAYELLCGIFDKQSDIMLSIKPEYKLILAPQRIIYLAQEHMENAYKVSFNNGDRLKMFGVEVLPGYEYKVILYHKEYSFFQEEDFKVEIKILSK